MHKLLNRLSVRLLVVFGLILPTSMANAQFELGDYSSDGFIVGGSLPHCHWYSEHPSAVTIEFGVNVSRTYSGGNESGNFDFETHTTTTDSFLREEAQT